MEGLKKRRRNILDSILPFASQIKSSRVFLDSSCLVLCNWSSSKCWLCLQNISRIRLFLITVVHTNIISCLDFCNSYLSSLAFAHDLLMVESSKHAHFSGLGSVCSYSLNCLFFSLLNFHMGGPFQVFVFKVILSMRPPSSLYLKFQPSLTESLSLLLFFLQDDRFLMYYIFSFLNYFYLFVQEREKEREHSRGAVCSGRGRSRLAAEQGP